MHATWIPRVTRVGIDIMSTDTICTTWKAKKITMSIKSCQSDYGTWCKLIILRYNFEVKGESSSPVKYSRIQVEGV